MELTEGILKSVESSFMQDYNNESYIVKYKGKIMNDTRLRCVFRTEGAAKTFITRFITDIFRHGDYWHKYSGNVKTRTGGYQTDYSGTINIDIWHNPNSKKMIKNLGLELLKQGIITIEKVEKTKL